MEETVIDFLIEVIIFFFIVCIPYTDNNIPKSIFYSALVGKFFRIARSSLLYRTFNEKAMELFNRIKAQSVQSLGCRKVLSKVIQRHEKAFANFVKNCDEIVSELHI